MTSNRKLAEIKNLYDAKNAWETFFGRFFSNELPKNISVDFNPNMRKFYPRENKNAKYNSPFNSIGRTDHSDDFDDFLNGNTVTIPEKITLNVEGLEVVEEAIKNGDFAIPVFKKLDHIYYALWLFKQNKITRQQMGTFLACYELKNKVGHPILDENGNFTKEANKLLLPIIKNNSFHNFTDTHKERFRLLIEAAPKSEQVFYLSDSNQVKLFESTIKDSLEKYKTWYSVCVDKYNIWFKELHLSFGTIDAWQIALNGTQGAAATRPCIGNVSLNTIKSGVQYYSRATAVYIPESGVESANKNIHNCPILPMSQVTAHDVYHAKLHNTIPSEFHLMLNHMANVIIKHTNPPNNWSKFLWQLADREFLYFYLQNQQSSNKTIELTLDNGAKFFEKFFSKEMNHHLNLPFPTLDTQLTDEGIAIIFDMIKHKEEWKNLYKIDIRKFSNPYKSYIDKMDKFIKTIGDVNCSPEFFNLKFRLYCETLAHKGFYETDKYAINLIKDIKNIYCQNSLKFTKIKDGKYKNHTILEFSHGNNKIEVNANNLDKFIPLLIKNKLCNGHIDNELIRNKLTEIRTKFKSIHPNNELSNNLIDESLEVFSSLEEKLCFLENCIEQIKSSKFYVHKNPTIDKLFSFVKNPLTASQQQHISQIHSKIIGVIEDHTKVMDNNQYKEFLWQLESRNPKLKIYQQLPRTKLNQNPEKFCHYNFV